jgi:SAM-dependent methyltransferase
MKTEWDYTQLAQAYLKRPDYSPEALDKLFKLCGLSRGARVCDVGAGVAHLTLKLAQEGFEVRAVEPNDAMRAQGQRRTAGLKNVAWSEGTGEATGQPDQAFDLVTFGSSFNVCDRALALKESFRILKAGGTFACMWNHRDLEDPLQASLEGAIKARLTGYDYGTRREDQSAVIDSSGLFGSVKVMEGRVLHRQKVEDCLEAWRSHATLQRQAGPAFDGIIREMEKILLAQGSPEITVPYTTRIWAAPKKA